MNEIDQRALRDAFGSFMTGVTVVTTVDRDGMPAGFTANSFTSVSLDPPLLLVCPGKHLRTIDSFATCDAFGISILAEGQEEVSATFASSKADRFAATDHIFDDGGIPLICGAVATFSCRTHQVVDAGDHIILIGEVTAFTSINSAALGYHRGQYFSLGLERSARRPEAPRNICGAIIRAAGTVLLERTAEGLRPPQVAVPHHKDIRSGLRDFLSRSAIEAELGPVYSVFDDSDGQCHHAYLLATATQPDARRAKGNAPPMTAIPINTLSEVTFASSAIASMMRRFARETESQGFTFYLGDARQGDTHALVGRG